MAVFHDELQAFRAVWLCNLKFEKDMDDLTVNPGAGILALVDVSHSRAGKDFNGATTKPGLSQKEKVNGSSFSLPVCVQLAEHQEARATSSDPQSAVPPSKSVGSGAAKGLPSEIQFPVQHPSLQLLGRRVLKEQHLGQSSFTFTKVLNELDKIPGGMSYLSSAILLRRGSSHPGWHSQWASMKTSTSPVALVAPSIRAPMVPSLLLLLSNFTGAGAEKQKRRDLATDLQTTVAADSTVMSFERAERGSFQKIVTDGNASDNWRTDNAATSAYEAGTPLITEDKAIMREDFATSDYYILCMDENNPRHLNRKSNQVKTWRTNIELLGSPEPQKQLIIEDPYNGND
ncbi:hypothetical protein A6R68_17156 [Neotoma lepida]|uniref:Phosphotyrosine protein phosphatase I domain-containing protein n=1 Tax=Neotoma lepida TaxID=56216 RepID=A0A1A6HFI7_NEOLE|nr:hypothetical protein A6R68_17156 [Neotoma lepida]